MNRNHGQGHSYFPRSNRRERVKSWFKAHRFTSILAGSAAAGLIVSFGAFLIALVMNKITEATPTILWLGGFAFLFVFVNCIFDFYLDPLLRPGIRQFTKGVHSLLFDLLPQIASAIMRKFRK